MVEVTVSRLGLDGSTNTYVVILQERDGERILPIWIGQPEAESILLEINKVHKDRPLTHDLCKGLILALGATLQHVHITQVQSRTYYAELWLERGGEVFHVDARPSDSIAIALRMSAPVFAAESLLAPPPEAEESSEEPDEPVIPPTPPPRTPRDMTAEQLKEYLAGLRPEDFGKFTP